MRLRIAAALVLLVVPASRAQMMVTQVDTSRTVVFAGGQARQTVAPDRASLTILIDAQAMSADERGVGEGREVHRAADVHVEYRG